MEGSCDTLGEPQGKELHFQLRDATAISSTPNSKKPGANRAFEEMAFCSAHIR
jgi:hypothetical protein